MSTPINTDITIDYFSVIHRNLYRMRIDPKQRCIIKEYLRLIKNESDENPGNPPVFWPYQHDPKPTYAGKCQSGGRANQTPSSWRPWQRSFTDSHQQRNGPTKICPTTNSSKPVGCNSDSPKTSSPAYSYICPRRRRSMKQTLHLRYAMQTWAFTLQISSIEEQSPSPFTLLKRIESSLRCSSSDFRLERSLLACSRIGDSRIGDWVTYRCWVDVGLCFQGRPSNCSNMLA